MPISPDHVQVKWDGDRLAKPMPGRLVMKYIVRAVWGVKSVEPHTLATANGVPQRQSVGATTVHEGVTKYTMGTVSGWMGVGRLF